MRAEWILLPIAALSLATVSVTGSCEYLSQRQEITAVPPAVPRAWRGRLDVERYLVRYVDRELRLRERVVENLSSRLVVVEAQKDFLLPVTATPLVPGLALPPAGGLYPLDLDEGNRLVLSWARGFASDLLLELICRGVDTSFFNTERLCREISERANGDPFNLDREGILEAVVCGRFRVTCIKPLPARTVVLQPGEGLWFTESPFSDLSETAEGEPLEIVLSFGFHHLFDRNSHTRYDLQVDENEVTLRKITDP